MVALSSVWTFARGVMGESPVRFFRTGMLLISATLSSTVFAQETEVLPIDDHPAQTTYERERANALESLKQSWIYNVELANERSYYPHNPKVIETYLAAMQAEIDGDIEKCMQHLEESYQLSGSESGESLWKVLRCNYSDAAEHLFYLVGRLEGYSYEEKLVEYDHFSRYQPSDDRIQAYLLETMLERMSYDAVFSYCERRIGEGHEVYRVLRAELRLLMQQEAIDRESVEYYKAQLWRTLDPVDFGVETLTAKLVNDEAFQMHCDRYDPTLVEARHVNTMLDEIKQEQTRNVARIRRYCTLLRVSYEMTHANLDAIRSYYVRSACIVDGPEAEFNPGDTAEQIESARQEALYHIRTCEAEVTRKLEEVERNRVNGTYGRLLDRRWVSFDFNLYKRWEREADLKARGEAVSFQNLEEIFP